jgi:hypothetical protein
MFPTIIESARAHFVRPLEIVAAKGFGRSYGQQSKFFEKKFSGILESSLWSELARARALPTFAIVADIGNDLAYETPVDTLVGWIEQTLDRLSEHNARVVLNNIPLASLRTVGPARYYVFRQMFFPSCRLSRREMIARAERLNDSLGRLASERKTPVFSGEIEWYGLDPIHPCLPSAGRIWSRMIGELTSPSAVAPLVRPTLGRALQLRRLRPESWVQSGVERRASQPCTRLTDGTTLSLF